MTQKAAFKKMIGLDAEEVVCAVKIMVALVFEIDGNNIHMEMALMNQNTMVLLQIVVLGSEIWYLGTAVFLLVSCLVDIVTKEQQLWILYHKFGQLC